MRMIHPRIRSIGNSISRLHHRSGIDHIFIKNRPVRKSTGLQINLPVISRTHIGAEKRLNPILLNIRSPLHRWLLRVIKGTGIFLQKTAVLFGKLSCIRSSHLLTLCQCTNQIPDQMPVRRKCILRHKYHNIRIRHFCCPLSGSAMVKIFLLQMMHFQNRRFLPLCIPVLLSCIHDQNPVWTILLFFQSVDQFSKLFSWFICGNNHINFSFFHLLFLTFPVCYSQADKSIRFAAWFG